MPLSSQMTALSCLEQLDVSHNRVATLPAGLATMDRLVSLDLSYCDHVSDAALNAIGNGCLSLTLLDLTGCALLTDAAMTGLLSHAPCAPLLEELGLGKCERVGGGAVLAAA